jgi:polysaccharide transporter, PST family
MGPQYYGSIIVLRIFAFLPLVLTLSNILGMQIMLTFNMKEAFARILLAAAAINLTLAFSTVYFYKEIGIACSSLITEIFVVVAMFSFLKKKGVEITLKG